MKRKRLGRILMTIAMMLVSINSVADDQSPWANARIVKFKSASGLHTQSHTQSDLTQIPGIMTAKSVPMPSQQSIIGAASVSDDPVWILTFESKAAADAYENTLSQSNTIDYIEPIYDVTVFAANNDPLLSEQWYINNTALSEWVKLPGAGDILVAVVDTGIDYTHSDLINQMARNENDPIDGFDNDQNGFIDDYYGHNFYGYYFAENSADPIDEMGHGTHVAGTLGAQSRNGIGIMGMNTSAKLLSVRFLNHAGRGNQLDAAAALIYAADRGAKVINCSWGYRLYNQVLADAVAYAQSKGAIIVAAAGNSASGELEYPAAFPGVVAIGSLDQNGNPSYFSSYGTHVKFATYGEDIYATAMGGGYTVKSGTSQASAIFSGILSRIWSAHPTWSADDILTYAQNKAIDIYTTGIDQYTGFGVINYNTVANELYSLSLPSSNENDDDPIINSAPSLQLSRVMNFPNPVPKSGTSFGFDIQGVSGIAELTITVFDQFGKKRYEKNTLAVSNYNAIYWDGKDNDGQALENGTYFYLLKLSESGQTKMKKGVLSIVY